MATSPQYASTPIVGSNVLGATADTSYTAPTHTVTILSAASVTVASVTVTSGSPIATVSSGGFASVLAGMYIQGSGVPGGTTVVAVVGNSLYMSANASSTPGSQTLTFQSNGIKVDEVDFVGAGTTVAGVTQLYLYDGTTYHAYFSQLVTVVTPSTTTAPFFQAQPFTNLEIPPGWSLVATSFVASQLMNVVAFGGSL